MTQHLIKEQLIKTQKLYICMRLDNRSTSTTYFTFFTIKTHWIQTPEVEYKVPNPFLSVSAERVCVAALALSAPGIIDVSANSLLSC